MGSTGIQVGVATESERRDALELVLRPLPPASRGTLLDSLSVTNQHGLGPLSALIVARNEGDVAAATWAQPTPGQTASLWLPEWRRRVNERTAAIEESLISQAMAISDSSGVSLTQALFESNDDPRIPVVESLDFQWIAKLEYQSRIVNQKKAPPRSQSKGISFEPSQASDYERIKRVLKATYVGSLDCPGLDDMRDLEDVLQGYRASGHHDPSIWFFVTENQTDIGALLLAEHPESEQLELIYMGLAPEARGQGLGSELVSQTLRVAEQLGMQQVVVAVDSANEPAKKVYQQAGFSAWAERSVYIRTHPSKAK